MEAEPPPAQQGFDRDHNRVCLGSGEATWRRARAGISAWRMFDLPWVTLHAPPPPAQVGHTVGVEANFGALRWLHACRVVYDFDRDDGALRRFGFAYGTLPDHAESGEERFCVEWHRADDRVWYDLLAYSRPRHPLARLGYPFTRRMQARFARGSMRAMQRAAAG